VVRISVIPILLLAVALAARAQPTTSVDQTARSAGKRPTLPPRDESARDPQLHAFLRELRAVVAKRDTAALLKIVDPGITLDFGGTNGIENLKKRFEYQESADEFWRELGIVLDMGGTFDGPDKFEAPYVSAQSDTLDSFGDHVVTATGVRLRAQPNTDARTVASLDYDIVNEVESREFVAGWKHVRLWNGQTGYVASQYVRNPIDYRAWFERTRDGWRLMGFLAGD
jgi:hypothetical protein